MEQIVNGLMIFGIAHVASALALTAAHYFPWHGGRHELERTTAYTVGTCVVVGVPVMAMLLVYLTGGSRTEPFWAWLLLANTAVCGATVKLAYWIDQHQIRPITLDEVRGERG